MRKAGIPLNIAHRGGRGNAPENTLRAFSLAGSSGADGVEFDVQRTRDGKLVIFHDNELKRITGVKGCLKDITFDELRKLDAGGGEKVPALEETLEIASKYGLILIIELKNPEFFPGIEKEAWSLVSSLYKPGLVKIACFNAASLESVRLIEPSISLVRNYRFDTPASGDHYDAASVDARNLILFPWRERIYRRHCKDIYVWSVNSRAAMKHFIRCGVDAIITDYPDRLGKILER